MTKYPRISTKKGLFWFLVSEVAVLVGWLIDLGPVASQVEGLIEQTASFMVPKRDRTKVPKLTCLPSSRYCLPRLPPPRSNKIYP